MTELRTERLLLRRARPSDLDGLHALLSDPVVMRYGTTAPHTMLEESRVWLEKMIATTPAEGDDFLVEYEGNVIGKAGLYRFPEIGFMFIPSMWGRGFATEAVRAVCAHVFATHDMKAIKADVDPRNTASLAVLARIGFIETGRASNTWLLGGEWCDSVYLELAAT